MSEQIVSRLEQASVWRATVSGFCASFVGIGLARFVYTPLIPAQIAAGWFTPSQSGYLGAANLLGYLIGAVLARRMSSLWNPVAVVRAMMALAAASFFLSSYPVSFPLYFAARFLAGYGGGAVMVLAAPLILAHIDATRRGIVSGAIFTGVGLGIAASGTLTTTLLQHGLTATWQAFGVIAAVFTVLGWSGWPRGEKVSVRSAVNPSSRESEAGLGWLYAEYGLCAVGLVPHMVFLVDFVSRGLGEGIDAGARIWIVAGIGAVCGPIVFGRIADYMGFRLALRSIVLLETLSLAAIAAAPSDAVVVMSAALVGAFVPGCVPLALGRMHDVVKAQLRRQKAWATCSIVFSLGMAISGYGYSYLFAVFGSHSMLFAFGAGAMFAALICDFLLERYQVHTGVES